MRQPKNPWIKLDANDFTIGFGVCTNNEPQSMTWNRARVVMNAEIQDLWPNATLAENEEYILVCCMFSREQNNRRRNRLDVVLESMEKWNPLHDMSVRRKKLLNAYKACWE